VRFTDRVLELGALAGCERPGLVLIQGAAGVGKTALVERFLAGERIVWRACGERGESSLSGGVLDQWARRGAPSELILSEGVVFLDDAQWADPASVAALVYGARRSSGGLFVVCSRPCAGLESVSRLASVRLWLDALPHHLLAELSAVPLSDGAALRLWEHAGGDLRLALDLLQEVPPSTWGDFERRLPASRELAASVAHRLESCDADTRALVEAASVLGSGCRLSDAAALAGLTPGTGGAATASPAAAGESSLRALEVAISAELLVEGERRTVAFAPPAVGAAVYARLGPVRRAALHRGAAALAEDEHAELLHLAAAAAGPDGALAARLDSLAGRTRERPEAAAALLAASRVSPTRALREDRFVRAVDWMLLAGDAAQARGYTNEVAGCVPSARRDSVLGQLAIAGDRVREAGDWLRSAWNRCEDDGELAAIIAHRNAFHALIHLDDPEVEDWARRALALAPDDPLAVEWHATLALSTWRQGRSDEAHALLAAALSGDAERDAQLHGADAWLRIVSDDIEGACDQLAAAAATELRLGAQEIGVVHLNVLARAHFEVGAWDAAVAVADQAVAHASQLEDVSARMWAWWAALLVPAARGDDAAVAEYARRAAAEPTDAPDRVVAVGIAQAVAAASRGDAPAVLTALDPVAAISAASAHPGTTGVSAAVDEPGFWPWQDLYGAALVAAGRLEEAAVFLAPHERLAADRGHATATARLAVVRGRLEAALGNVKAAELAFEHALDALQRKDRPFVLAHAQLAYGRFLRRERRRRAAATLLTAAAEGFEVLDARRPFEAAQRELEASGLKPARRGESDERRLTPQELTVARLVAGGASNRAVAADLQLSVKTVEVHLTRIYAKLGIRSRNQLARRLAEGEPYPA